jgi:hypothetical protein
MQGSEWYMRSTVVASADHILVMDRHHNELNPLVSASSATAGAGNMPHTISYALRRVKGMTPDKLQAIGR